MTELQLGLLIVLGVCILASGFFSGSETALVAVPRERVHLGAGASRRGRRLAELTADPERMLGTLLLANNFVNILAAAAATTLAIQLIGEPWGPWVATIAITSLILVIGEITPKTLAARHPEAFALVVATPIYWLSRVIHPVAQIFIFISRGLLRLLGVTHRGGPVITEEDITALAALGELMGEIDTEERQIIESLFDLADRPVRDVMTPHVDVVSLDTPLTETDIRRVVAETGHSRFPIRRRGTSLDEVAGVLYIKDVLSSPDELRPARIRELARQPVFVPESTPILKLLQDMRTRRFGFGIVVDEHGGVEGIVTIKDLMSELVGDIQDEYDPGVPTSIAAGDGTWIADGRLPVDELAEQVGVAFPEGPYSTVGGMFLAAAGHIPEEGQTVELDGVAITVLRMEGRRIDRVRVEVAGEQDPDPR
ncbi:MAG: hemolysin family protein [Acidimicrobiia bacterium]